MSDTIIVTDAGFGPDPWAGRRVASLAEVTAEHSAVLLPPDTPADTLRPLLATLHLVVIPFDSFADGRGFGLARRLRLLGYRGRLRARGHVLADQYAMARRAGFDEVELTAALAARQGHEQWLFRANWQAHDYQARLRGQPLANMI
jgi:uncharacterized protein (DUF934 family)